MINILIIENDIKLLEKYTSYINKQGYQVYKTTNEVDFIEIYNENEINFIIIGSNSQTNNNYGLLEQIRNLNSSIPILVIGHNKSFSSLKKAYDYKIDDYLISPINCEELLLRINSILRRCNMLENIYFGNTYINKNKLTISYNNKEYSLPQKEFNLLYKLITNPEIIISREQILTDIWGWDLNLDDRTLNTHIYRLREKLIDNEDFDIITIRRLGYKLTKKRKQEIT